jgi:LacI family transcriptional regulator
MAWNLDFMPNRLTTSDRLILLALYVYDPRIHRGVLRFARERGWRVRLLNVHTWSDHADERPDGVISMFEPPAESHGMTEHVLSLGVPIVELSLVRPEIPVARIPPDCERMGAVAAEYLQKLGRNFLFVAWSRAWADMERLAGFQSALARIGCETASLFISEAGIRGAAAMAEAMKSLPRPLQVFCSYDKWAELVLDACLLAGWRVPEEVAILGCYNHELLSAMAQIPISSIEMNSETRGYLAAAFLEEILQGRADLHGMRRTPVGEILERASTNRQAIADPLVLAAIQYIRANLERKISVAEITESVGASRAALQRRFQKAVRHGVGEEITRQRIEKAREILSTSTLKASVVAEEVGYPSAFQFFRAFKKHTGMTAMEYRSLVSSKAPVQTARK